jgi:hypothetical protein
VVVIGVACVCDYYKGIQGGLECSVCHFSKW